VLICSAIGQQSSPEAIKAGARDFIVSLAGAPGRRHRPGPGGLSNKKKRYAWTSFEHTV
jgi:hypothetical protein